MTNRIKLISLIAVVVALSVVPVALSRRRPVCPPGTHVRSYCGSIAITGGDRNSATAAEQAALAIANAFSPGSINQTLRHGSFKIVLTKLAAGTYTVTVTNKKGLVIGTGTVVFPAGRASDVARAAAVSKTMTMILTAAGKKYVKAHQTTVLTVSATYKPKHGKQKTSRTAVQI
jgi:hypothetical protein